jgi:glutaredoxin-related protein
LKEVLSEKGIKFAYFDICLDFGALKRFLKLRDTHPVFIPVKEAGRVGIPAILIDDEVMLELEDAKIEELLK